jgi:probable HAF family extracellular repeat protein
MNPSSITHLSLRRRTLAGLFVPFALMAGSMAGAAGQDDAASRSDTAPSSCGCLYSVINLDPDGLAASYLNERGEAAVGSLFLGTNRFFDGERLIDVVPTDSSYTWIRGLNNRGVVTGESVRSGGATGPVSAFVWSAARGLRTLPGSIGGTARAINDNNQVVGFVQTTAPGVRRAVRWDPNGRIVNLGPVPLSGSEAYAINDNALAGGFADVANGDIHATLWDPAGRVTDLGTLGGGRGFIRFVNERSQAAGSSDNGGDVEYPFFWSARDGLVTIPAPNTVPAGLNERGEVIGFLDNPTGSTAYLWSRARGLTVLPRGTALQSNVVGLNNHSVMVGSLQRSSGDFRGVRWNGVTNPVDLTTLLYRPPAGLVVEVATAINDAGDILAYTNAGLVMLRPGTRGTDAPVLGPIAGLPDNATFDVGQDLRLSLGFVDNSRTQTHRASVTWSDGCPSTAPQVRESGGVGEATFRHRFCTPGLHYITVLVTDSGGRRTEARKSVLVNTPGTATLSGQGTLNIGTAGSTGRSQPLRFALWAPLDNAALSRTGASSAGTPAAGTPFLALSGPVQFQGEQLEALDRNGQTVRLQGSGRFNGQPGYRFLVEATDAGPQQAGTADSMRVRISHVEAGKEVVDYDNGAAAKAASASVPVSSARTQVASGGIALSL